MSSTSHVPNINPTNMDRTSVLVSHTEPRLYHNGVASEGVRLSFAGESIVVNKTVLTNASEVFAAAFNGHFSNTATQEYTIEGYSRSTVLELLNHIFDTNTDFGIIWWESLDDAVKKEACYHLREVLLIADEYGLPELGEQVRMAIVEIRENAYSKLGYSGRDRTHDAAHNIAVNTMRDMVIDLYKNNYIPDMSLMEDVAWQCAYNSLYEDHSAMYQKADVEGPDHVTRNQWVAKAPEYEELVRVMHLVEDKHIDFDDDYDYSEDSGFGRD
ncbi:hypothetical protein D6D00_08044 [Aureobasidium pullulans]|nr:hypothetical protein D6D00_08044 [Aureobasidium pullulans]